MLITTVQIMALVEPCVLINDEVVHVADVHTLMLHVRDLYEAELKQTVDNIPKIQELAYQKGYEAGQGYKG